MGLNSKGHHHNSCIGDYGCQGGCCLWRLVGGYWFTVGRKEGGSCDGFTSALPCSSSVPVRSLVPELCVHGEACLLLHWTDCPCVYWRASLTDLPCSTVTYGLVVISTTQHSRLGLFTLLVHEGEDGYVGHWSLFHKW